LLRHGLICTDKRTWTQAHFRWLEEVRLEHPVQQIVFQEYVDAVKQSQERASRFPARKSAHLQRKAEETSEVVQACTAIAAALWNRA
jgi:hypothetical protein